MSLRHALLALTVVLLWGLNFSAAKFAVSEIPPVFVLFLRFVMVSALLVPFVPFPRGRLKDIALLSTILGTLHFSLIFMGIRGIDSGTAAIITQLQVPFSSLLAAYFFRDRLGWRRLSGMAVAFIGVVVVAGQPRFEGSLGAVLILVCASFAFACANIQIKRIGTIDGFQLNGWMAFLALPQVLLVSFLFEHGQLEAAMNASLHAWMGVAYSAVMSTIAAYGIWYWLLARHEVNQVVPFILFLPLVGVAGGSLALGEPLTWALVGGGLLTIVGVGVILFRRPGTVNDRVSNPS